jgi:hypothetical protein
MLWPIIRGKSYVGEAFKSMKAVGTAVAQKDGLRHIAITLIEAESLRPDQCQAQDSIRVLSSMQ